MDSPAYRPAREVLDEKDRKETPEQIASLARAYRGHLRVKPDNLPAIWVYLDALYRLGRISQEQFHDRYAECKAAVNLLRRTAGLDELE